MHKYTIYATKYLSILTLFCILATPAPLSAADKWADLLQNRIPVKQATEKAAEGEAARPYPQLVADLLADYLRAEVDVNIRAQAEAVQKLFEVSKGKPEGEVFLEMMRYSSLPDCSQQRIVEAYKFDGCAPNVQRALAYLKLWALDKESLSKEQRKEYVTRTGKLDAKPRIIGPFNYLDYDETEQLNAAELDPAAENYPQSMGCNVHVTTIAPDDRGNFPTGNILPETALPGMIDMQFTFTSETGRECLIYLDTPRPNRVWLNGERIFTVYDRGNEEFPLSSQYYLKIRLKKGVNCLLLKNEVDDSIRFDLLNFDGSPLKGIQAIPFSAEAWKNALPRMIGGYVFSAPVIGLYMPSLLKLCKEMPQPAGDILLAHVYRKCYYTQKAMNLWEDLVQKYPESSVVKALYANFLQQIRDNGPDSSERLMSQAATLLRELQKDAPQLLMPQLQLAEYYRSVRQPKQEQKIQQQLAEKFPTSAEVQHRLSQYYENKGWPYLATQAMDKCVALMPEAAQWKVNLLLRQKQYVLALLQAEKAYQEKHFCSLKSLKKMRKRYAKFLPEDQRPAQEDDKAGAADKDKNAKEEAADPDEKVAPAAKEVAEDDDEDDNEDDEEDDNEIIELEEDYQDAMNVLDIPEAIRLLKRLAELNPDNPERWAALGRLEIRNEKNTDAAKHLTKAFILGCRQHKPNTRLLRLIRQLQRKPLPDLKYLHKLTPEMIAQAEKGKDAHASHATLIRTRVLELFPGIGGILTVRNAIKVFDRNGINELSEMEVKGEVLFCKTIAPDGKEFIPDSAENINLKKAMSMYNVQPGSVLDVATRSYFPNSGQGDESINDSFYFQDFNADVKMAEYVLILPRQMLKYANIETFPENLEPEIKEISKVRVALIWKMADLKGIKAEPGMPEANKVVKNVQIRFFPRNKQFPAQTYFENPLNSNSEIEKQAEEICKDLKTVQEQVRAIYNWITLNINESDSTETPRDTFALRSGDSDNMLDLCHAMLKARGIESTYCHANTYLNYPAILDPDFRAGRASIFDWPRLLRVHTGTSGPDLWLEFSEGQRFRRMSDISQNVPGALAMENSGNGLTLCHVMQDQVGISPFFMPEIIELFEDGSAKVKMDFTTYGDSAPQIRHMLENPLDRKQRLEGLAAESFPGITDLDFQITGDEKLESLQQQPGKLKIVMSGKLANFSQPIDGKMVVQRNMKSKCLYYAVELPRTYPLVIEDDLFNADQQHYIAPEGWAFVPPTGDCWLDTPFGLFCVDYTIKGRNLYRSLFCIVPAQKIQPEDCADFNRFLEEVKKRTETSFTLEKISPEAIKTPFKEQLPEEGFPGSFLQRMRLPANLQKLLDDQTD